MTRIPKYVVSSTLDHLGWQYSHRLTGDPTSAITDVKDRTDGDLVVFGSGSRVRGLAEHDLIDEYRLLRFPVTLSAGKRMFDDRGHFARFELSDRVVAPGGVVILTYRRHTPA